MKNLIWGISLIIIGIICFGIACTIVVLDKWENPFFSFYILMPIMLVFVVLSIGFISFGWLNIDDWKCFYRNIIKPK